MVETSAEAGRTKAGSAIRPVRNSRLFTLPPDVDLSYSAFWIEDPCRSSTLAHLNPNSRAGLSARMRFRIPLSGARVGWRRRDRGTTDAESRFSRLIETTT